jgi:oligoendopeptidase F
MAAQWLRLNLYNYMKYTLDAKEKRSAELLQKQQNFSWAKIRPEFVRNAIPQVEVEIINASKADIPLKKHAREAPRSIFRLPKRYYR